MAPNGASTAGSRVRFATALTTADRCTSPVSVKVALRGRAGKARPGTAVLHTVGTGASRLRDADTLRLVCVPAK